MNKNFEYILDNEKDKINKNKQYQIILNLLYIIMGAICISAGINIFLLPQKLTTGGASGIATVIYYLFKIPLGVTTLCINIPLFVIAIKKLGLNYSIKTITSTVLLSLFLDIFTFNKILGSINTDPFTSCLFGGLLVGIGLSLTFRAGASSGGSDLLAQIIYKCTKIQSMSQILLVIEVVIISSVIIVFKDLNLGLYSIIAMYISTKVIDILFEGIYYTKEVKIITRKSDEIAKEILNSLKRGATITKSIGAHSQKHIDVITCVITRPQLAKLKEIVRECDDTALMYISTVNEAMGEGFKNLK